MRRGLSDPANRSITLPVWLGYCKAITVINYRLHLLSQSLIQILIISQDIPQEV